MKNITILFNNSKNITISIGVLVFPLKKNIFGVMIQIIDDFLTNEQFRGLQEYCEQPFRIEGAGTKDQRKEFLILDTPEWIKPELELEGHEVIFSFIRKAHKDFDIDPRIHSDGIIMDKYTDVASVLYINESEGVTPNGTMFFDHDQYGDRLPKDADGDLYNKMLKESNTTSHWTPTDKVYSKPNRMLSYPANYFHSKFPARIVKGERVVLVTFYTEI